MILKRAMNFLMDCALETGKQKQMLLSRVRTEWIATISHEQLVLGVYFVVFRFRNGFLAVGGLMADLWRTFGVHQRFFVFIGVIRLGPPFFVHNASISA